MSVPVVIRGKEGEEASWWGLIKVGEGWSGWWTWYYSRFLSSLICSQVYSIPLGGMCVRQPFAIGGQFLLMYIYPSLAPLLLTNPIAKMMCAFSLSLSFPLPPPLPPLPSPLSLPGSGSTYIYGLCDANFKPGMTKEECLHFATNGNQALGGLTIQWGT